MQWYACLALLLLFTLDAAAVCPVFPTHYLVGADATFCTHNTIQAAIDAVGSCPIVIDVTREHLYGSGGFCTPSQSGGCHLSINDKINVTLQAWGDGVGCYNLTQCVTVGGCPPPASTAPLVTLDGASSGGSVVAVSGHSNVSLRNFTITHGAAVTIAGNGTGGGINFNGYGSLTLENSTVGFNSADYGAGIDVNGSGGTALLTLNANTLILSNTAQNDGGGIRITNSAHLVADQAWTLVAYNHAASGAGGGLAVYGPAHADVGSPGYANFGVIYDNDAVLGGGAAVYAGTNSYGDEGLANFYTTDPQHPVTVEQNFASSKGGAFYAKGFSSYGGPIVWGTVCMSNYRIAGNAAPDGAIAYLDWDTSLDEVDFGSRLFLDKGSCGSGVACAPGVPCHQAYDNVSQNASAQTTSGSAIVVGTSSVFQAGKLDLRGSTGDYLVRIVGDNDYAYPVQFGSCVIADNTPNSALVIVQGNNVELDMDNCTVTDNSGDLPYFTNLTNSLVFEPGKQVGAVSATYVIANDATYLPAGATIQVTGDPRFVDAASGDYHLRLDSPAVDYAGGLGGTDLDGYPRDVDLAAHPNQFGPRDLGAYERQSDYACDDAADALFCNGFDGP